MKGPESYELKLLQQIVCLAYLKPLQLTSVVDVLNTSSRAAVDFWMMTKYAQHALILLQVAAVVLVPEPVQFRARLGFPPSAVFFGAMTQMCVDTCAASLGLDDDLGLLRDWSAQFGFDLSTYLCDGKLAVSTVLHMPLPHALLVANKVWQSWMMPFLVGTERRGHAYALGAQLYSTAVPRDVDLDPIGQDTFGPHEMLQIADVLRHCLAGLPQATQILRDNVQHQVTVFFTFDM